MTLRLVGANPCVTLYGGDQATAYAFGVWTGRSGSGHALVLATRERIRIIGPDSDLGSWLGSEFNRHIRSVSAGIRWSEPELTVAPVRFDLDLAMGFRASADDVTVEITDPIERYLTRNDEYDLGGTPNLLSTVWIPCKGAPSPSAPPHWPVRSGWTRRSRCRARLSPMPRCGAPRTIRESSPRCEGGGRYGSALLGADSAQKIRQRVRNMPLLRKYAASRP